MRHLTNFKIIFGLFLSLTGYSFGQEHSLDWNTEPKEILTEKGPTFVLDFLGAVHGEEFAYLPAYPIDLKGNVAEVTIKNAQYKPLQEWELTFLDPKYLGTEPTTEILHYTKNGEPISSVTVFPLRVNPKNNVAEKLVAFDLELVYSKTPVGVELKTTSTTSSVFSSGTIYKLSVISDGIYKIDYDYLSNMGVDVDNINPNSIHLYGNGGGMLPQANDESRYDDVTENRILIVGGNDGSFDENDYILFMGHGQTKWDYDSNSGRFKHTKNLYDDVNHYFLKIDNNANGLRVNSAASVSGATKTFTAFDEHVAMESDQINLLSSGREWYGDEFNFTVSRNYTINTPGLVAGTDLSITSAIMVASSSPNLFNVFANGNLLGQHNNNCTNTPCATTAAYGTKGGDNTMVFNLNASALGNPSAIYFQYDFNKLGNTSARGFMNYIAINYKRSLTLFGNKFLKFRAAESLQHSVSAFNIAFASAFTRVWDITEPTKPLAISGTLSGTTYAVGVETDTLREFIAFNINDDFQAPTFEGTVANQNIHGITTPPELLIITHASLVPQAERLAAFRRSNDNMTVSVLTVDQIYNEFSSGNQDVTALRDCAKMLYDRGDASNSLKYILLFGDASYDYKDRIPLNTNLVPVYESRQSLNNIRSYSSDDYFGFLDDDEGEWLETTTGNHSLDVGVGRLPVKNLVEATHVVNKLISYALNLESYGNWRNKVAFVADDGDNNLHLKDADLLANKVETNHDFLNVEKIYLDAYPQLSTPSGQSSPQTYLAIDKAMDNGVLVLNYTGHGGEAGWAEERILTGTQLVNKENSNNLPIFVTATCEFGRYENPSTLSSAEIAILNPNGGAIGLLTTTRAVYAFSNFAINNALYDYMFPTTDSVYKRFGEVIKDTKNTSSALISVNNRNFSLLGDPSMAIAIPRKRIKVTQINGVPVSSDADTIRALEKLTITGEVVTNLGSKMGGYNGELEVIIYDKKSEVNTLGNQNPKTSFMAQNNYIFKGTATITNGEFSISLIVPKDIAYQYEYGKISLYAKQDNGYTDATGAYTNLVVGGSSSTIVNDNTPPKIKLYMDDESFKYAGTTGSSPLFIAYLSDDNGINLASGGIGHDIVATLDGEQIIMNEYYNAEKDDYTQGKVLYQFNDLEGGEHLITLKVWDTHNNSATSQLLFIVEPDNQIKITDLYNYPNPFSDQTTIVFDHNRAGENLDVTLKIYNMTGYLVRTITKEYISSDSLVTDITWDGTDDSGKKIPTGVYIYHLFVRSETDETTSFKTQKLVIINN